MNVVGMRDIREEVGRYAYDGSCAFGSWAKSVSIGVYPILARAGGKGLKRGKVVARIKAPAGQIESLKRVAEAAALCLEAGVGLPKKTLTISEKFCALSWLELLQERLSDKESK